MAWSWGLEDSKESHVQTHKLESILNKNSVFNLIFYISFDDERRVEWVTGNMSCGKVYCTCAGVCVCWQLFQCQKMVIKRMPSVEVGGVATNWVYKFAGETCPTIKQSYWQGPASLLNGLRGRTHLHFNFNWHSKGSRLAERGVSSPLPWPSILLVCAKAAAKMSLRANKFLSEGHKAKALNADEGAAKLRRTRTAFTLVVKILRGITFPVITLSKKFAKFNFKATV